MHSVPFNNAKWINNNIDRLAKALHERIHSFSSFLGQKKPSHNRQWLKLYNELQKPPPNVE